MHYKEFPIVPLSHSVNQNVTNVIIPIKLDLDINSRQKEVSLVREQPFDIHGEGGRRLPVKQTFFRHSGEANFFPKNPYYA